METISSTANPTIKRLRALKDAKARERENMFLVEGAVMLREALKCGLTPRVALMEHDDEALARDFSLLGARVYTVSRAVIEAVCDTKTPQGVCAAFDIPALEHLPAATRKLAALDGVQDPGNLGTILRTADALGLDGALLGAGCADPYSPKVQRAAMGSSFRVPISRAESLAHTLSKLKADGYTIIASALDGQDIRTRTALPDKWALIIGSEARGVSERVMREADLCVKIPMRGGAESLNAAVAAGILMYELTRNE